MGFIFSVVYFVVSFMAPEALLGSLAQYHVELILGVLTLIFSIPKMSKSGVLKMAQSPALLILSLVAFASTFLNLSWLGGAISVFIEFVSKVMAFFFVCLNFDSRKRLRVLVVAILVVCVIVIVRGSIDLAAVSGGYGPPINAQTGSADMLQWNEANPYLFPMANDEGEWLYRIRGLGVINDPNDFAQLLVTLVPLMFLFWQPKRFSRNLVRVFVPIALLVGGIFLTHSRGALLALTAMALVAARRKVGTVPAVILAACFFVGAMALQFSGGRDVSATAGRDRTALWGEGIAALRSHPLFGVGFNNLPEYTDNHLTAHNTVIVCASELGL